MSARSGNAVHALTVHSGTLPTSMRRSGGPRSAPSASRRTVPISYLGTISAG